jgi:RNA polymerase sigma factor (sigma-70 family)
VIVNRVGTQTNEVLLGWTQEYLRSLVSRGSPDSVLAVAWDEFYRIYDDLMRGFAVARGVRGSDVDDCLQAVWMEIARNLTDFEHPAGRPGLRSWLYTLVRSKACDLVYRQTRQRIDSTEKSRQSGREPIDEGPQPSERIEGEWQQAVMQTLLAELKPEISPANWRLLQMRFTDGCKVAEVAAELGLSPEEIRYRQFRLLKKLRKRAAALIGQPLDDDAESIAATGLVA